MQFILFVAFLPQNLLLEKQWKSLSFDAVVLLPLFMKCLFCFFNEIFNVKVLFFCVLFGERGKSRKHAKSNFPQKQFSVFLLLAPRKKKDTSEYIHIQTTMACEALFALNGKQFSSSQKSFSFLRKIINYILLLLHFIWSRISSSRSRSFSSQKALKAQNFEFFCENAVDGRRNN